MNKQIDELQETVNWFGNLLKKNFPEYFEDGILERQTGLTPQGLVLSRLKEEAGEIPDATCDDIDKVITTIDKINDHIKRSKSYESVEDYADDLDRCTSGDEEEILEKLRDENQRLRELGQFWYEKFKELLEKSNERSK